MDGTSLDEARNEFEGQLMVVKGWVGELESAVVCDGSAVGADAVCHGNVIEDRAATAGN